MAMHASEIQTSQFRAPRMAGLAALAVAAVGFIAYMSFTAPVKSAARFPRLTRSQITLHWHGAVAGVLLILALDALFILACRRWPDRAPAVQATAAAPADDRRFGVPAALGIQSVSGWALATTGLISTGVLAGGLFLRLPLWETVLFTLVPWMLVLGIEGLWKYERYGVYAVLFGLAILQVGHMGEHMAQVTQLMMYHGDASRAHGIFGQLDFETVHFVWDGVVWLLSGFLVWRFRQNRWLWIAWAVASIHQMEHVYLFWLNKVHFDFWARGGMAGIMAHGGIISSPLARPYLHFLYNFFVVVPLLVALWDQTKHVYDRRLARAETELSIGPLVADTERRPLEPVLSAT
jgi:hypothetical protein